MNPKGVEGCFLSVAKPRPCNKGRCCCCCFWCFSCCYFCCFELPPPKLKYIHMTTSRQHAVKNSLPLSPPPSTWWPPRCPCWARPGRGGSPGRQRRGERRRGRPEGARHELLMGSSKMRSKTGKKDLSLVVIWNLRLKLFLQENHDILLDLSTTICFIEVLSSSIIACPSKL